MLEVKSLCISLESEEGSIKIVDGVDLEIKEGEAVGLIGPTATGKTITAKAIMGLLKPTGYVGVNWKVEGEILWKGRDLLELPEKEFRELRGSKLSIIFQNPGSSLNPLLMIGYQTGETVEAHEEIERQRLRKMVLDHLNMVELPDAKRRVNFFRHQFSGGEAQRVMIAMALMNKPSLLIADEPTSDLDVTIQRQILELLKKVKKEFGISMLLITHDLGIIAEISDYVYVMYAGKIVEHGDVRKIFREQKHPYTDGLLHSLPRIDIDRFELREIKGEPPTPPYDISGCVFHPRCEHVTNCCKDRVPELVEVKPDHHAACLRICSSEGVETKDENH